MSNSIFEPEKKLPQARDYLTALYLDWRINYLTVEKFAEHNGLTEEHATKLLNVARAVYNSSHPDA